MGLLRLPSVLSPYVVVLFQLSCMLSLFHAQRQVCSTPDSTINGTHNTVTGALLAQAVCMSDYSRCDFRNVVNFSTNLLSYEGATPTVHINLNATDNLTTHYYTLCHSRPNTDKDKLMGCLASNKSQFDTVVKWRDPGLTTLIVAVYNDSSYNETSSFVDCDTADILVANNTGLSLDVTTSQEPKSQKIIPIRRSGPSPVNRPTVPTCNVSIPDNNKTYEVGNITFSASVNLTNYTRALFDYAFGDQTFYNGTSSNQTTHFYREAGRYSYSVHALVVLGEDSEAVHTSKRNNFDVYEGVSDPSVVVDNGHPVRPGVSTLAVKIKGSFPVTFCWCMIYPNSTACTSPHLVNKTLKTNITCREIHNKTEQPLLYNLNLTMNGDHHIAVNFSNPVDCYNHSFYFNVYTPSPPTPLIVSSATVGVLAALLAFMVIVIIIIVTVVIPYRRYKNRMTETANFKFIELNDSSGSMKGRMRRSASSLVNIFRSNKDSKVGLVNAGQGDVGGGDRLFGQGNSRVATFASYDSL